MSEEASPAQAVTGTLEEITQRIVMQVFREENYNQSRTAARLGISRTTLWRMLIDN
jgi:transcriptional regulator with PAS, ATPase and Fis domain